MDGAVVAERSGGGEGVAEVLARGQSIESNSPLSLVAVCGAAPRMVHVTVVPGVMCSVAGGKEES
jgi:hypothetical protein